MQMNYFFSSSIFITLLFFAMVGGLIIVPLVSLITPKLKKENVDKMFACYGEKVTVTKDMVLVEEENE